jgi:integrase
VNLCSVWVRWSSNVDLGRREIRIRGVNAKDREDRMLPITSRLAAVLEMRRHDQAGEPFGPEAFVFGDEIGSRQKSVRQAWERARIAAGLGDFHLADLRHEAASRWEEAGVGTHVVSKMLGHSNLKTTTIYVNANERQLHLAARRLDDLRADAALASSLQAGTPEDASTLDVSEDTAPQKSLVS